MRAPALRKMTPEQTGYAYKGTFVVRCATTACAEQHQGKWYIVKFTNKARTRVMADQDSRHYPTIDAAFADVDAGNSFN